MSIAGIAERYGVSESTVRRRLKGVRCKVVKVGNHNVQDYRLADAAKALKKNK